MTDVRPPCVICGAEGGNCGPLDGSSGKPDHVQFVEWGGDDRPTPSSKTKKEPIIMGNAVVATARIFERVPIPRSSRTRRVLRYAVGQIVPEDDVDRLRVKADGTQRSVPEADSDPAGVVPLAAKKAAKKATKKAAKRTTKKAAPRKKA